jgi:hypothetical protein
MGSYANPANRRGRDDHAQPMAAPVNDPYDSLNGEMEVLAGAMRTPDAIRATTHEQPLPQPQAEDRTGNF